MARPRKATRSAAPAPTEDLVRAIKLSLLPGVTIDEACQRFHVARAPLVRLRKSLGDRVRVTSTDLVMGAVTRYGKDDHGGALPELASLASYLDHVNRDGTTPDEARALLDRLVADGQLALDGEGWRLLRPWPDGKL